MKITRRAEQIEPFYVMELTKAAMQWTREAGVGARPVIGLNIGEPDFTAPAIVQQAAQRAIAAGVTQYSPALGVGELRERISQWYRKRFGLDVPARRIVVTAGASAALQLACLALIEAGDEVLMPDPCYPCNRHFVTAVEGRAVMVPTTAAERYQLSADKVAAQWTSATRAVLLASPSNPTGTSIHPEELRRIHATVRARGGVMLVDEIYLGLSYDDTFGHSALALGDDVISINSFSKYFSMTGWRLGWLVAPDALVPVLERLAQNFYICPSVVSQHAGLACFETEALAEYERRRAQFRARRDAFVPALEAMGLRVPVVPDGAFYAWVDASDWFEPLQVKDSWDLAFALLKRAQVAVAPGRDFGHAETARFIRFSIANSMENLREAIERLAALRA